MALLTAEHVSAAYGQRRVLEDVSLQLRSGEVVGLIGPNGAGKSTLLRAIAGTLLPSAGAVRLDGDDLRQLPPRERAKRIAVVPQTANIPPAFTVREVVLIGRTPYLSRFGGERSSDHAIVRTAMQRTATLALADRPVGQLSGGEQQRVLIARALAQQPQVLLLDEATAHLDLQHQTAILGLVRELAQAGLIVIAALHDVNLAALYADRLALLHEGRLLVCDTPRQVLTSTWLEQAYQVPMIVSRHPVYDSPMVALLRSEASQPPPEL